MRTRYKVLVWLTLAFVGVLISFFVGPMYASHYWPAELRNPSDFLSGTRDIEEMMLAMEKAKPIADTANKLIGFGNLITAVGVFGLAYTMFKHFRKQRELRHDQTSLTQTTK